MSGGGGYRRRKHLHRPWRWRASLTPEIDAVLARLRSGDRLVITRLDWLGRSVLHLITLGAEFRDRGIGLRVLEQGIDIDTADGRAMFRMRRRFRGR